MTINLPEDVERVLSGICDAEVVTKTSFVRDLIEVAISSKRAQYDGLHKVFSRNAGVVQDIPWEGRGGRER